MEYNFREIEKRWQSQWVKDKTYHTTEDPAKEKFYVLNMFPYPSGAGLHVGHPLGYIASDIYARYKRLKGFNVLNPMGYDAYGLPAEQYAIQTGQHPEVTTVANIARYRQQLDNIGFSFDWDREIRTCDPKYYHWTQWAFEKMFGSFFCNSCQKAQPIEKLVEHFNEKGTEGLDVAESEHLEFTAEEWRAMSDVEKQKTLMNYRIAYLGETMVNWCAGLGTVLANDEVVNGVSERGGFPVVQKKMQQWCLRTSAYSQRLLDGLETVDWSDSIKETQKNWIGRSEGTEMQFRIAPSNSPVGGELEAAWNKFNVIRRRMHSNNALVCLQKIEHEAEKRSLAGTVVAHKTKNITVVDGETFNVHGSVRAEVFLKITEFYFHILLIIYILTLASRTSPCSFPCIQPLPPAFPLQASVRHRVHLQVPYR